jgi:hypothetical protein
VELLPDDPVFFFIESTQVLPHRSRVGSDVQGVLSDFPRYGQHVRGTPRKYFDVRTEKLDEHWFLFGLELRVVLQRLLPRAARVEGDGLRGFGRLEVAGVLLGVGHLSSEVFQIGDEGLRVDERLGVFNTLDVALVGMMVSGANGDDARGPRHF